MTPQEALREAESGQLRPVYVVTGSEGFLRYQVTSALRAAGLRGGPPGFNHDKFFAQESDGETVVAAARTAPMMAARRVVEVAGVERWDSGKGDKGGAALDRLAAYLADPCPHTLMLITATKINGSRKVMRAAKKGGILVVCESPKRGQLPAWIVAAAKRRGHGLAVGVADALAELVGPDLGPVDDAVERLSLYVGPGAVIDEDALAAVVTRLRQDDVWVLVDALGSRNTGRALEALGDAFDARDAALPMLGAIAWRVRQLVKFEAALRVGAPGDKAAKAAGVPPFKARDLERSVKQIGGSKLADWLVLLAEADLALKGSRRPGQRVLETMVVAMCR